MKKNKKIFVILITFISFFTISVHAQNIETELVKIAVTENEMLTNFELVNQDLIDLLVYGEDGFIKALEQSWYNNSVVPQQRITIIYTSFNSIAQTSLDWINSSHWGPEIFNWGSYTDCVVGDFSWINQYEKLYVSNIIKENYAIILGVTGTIELKKTVLVEIVEKIVFPKIEQNLSDTIKQDLETKLQTQLSADTFDQVVSAKLVPYTKHELEESKWVIDENDYVLGRRQQWTDESGKMIGIDIAEFASQSDADSALKQRHNMARYMSHVIEEPLDPQIPSKTWLNEYFIGFPSVLFAYRNYAVHVYTNNPYLRGDSSGVVDTLLFDIARDVAGNINF